MLSPHIANESPTQDTRISLDDLCGEPVEVAASDRGVVPVRPQ
jgi:hypothetical protein